MHRVCYGCFETASKASISQPSKSINPTCRSGHGMPPRKLTYPTERLGAQSAWTVLALAALVPQPGECDNEAIAYRDQEIDVHHAPKQPAKEAAQPWGTGAEISPACEMRHTHRRRSPARHSKRARRVSHENRNCTDRVAVRAGSGHRGRHDLKAW